MDFKLRLLIVAAAIIASSGPLSAVTLLPMAWESLLDGRLLPAAGIALATVFVSGFGAMLVAGAIDTAYRAGLSEGRKGT